jgi:hypothetical protein
MTTKDVRPEWGRAGLKAIIKIVIDSVIEGYISLPALTFL